MSNISNTGVNVYEKECKEMKVILRGLAHEMGNALTVMGYSIKNFGKRQEVKEDENWGYINEDYNYICKLFKDLSAYNNSRELSLKKIDLDNMIKGIVSSLETEYARNAVSLEYLGKRELYVIADEVKIKQVFVNIIKNAYEAVCANDLNGEGAIDITVEENDDKYIIRFCDNGCGIKKENAGKIFEPMYTVNKEGGTGMGLYISKNIIESHGGNIKVSSVVKKGTIFEIELKKDANK